MRRLWRVRPRRVDLSRECLGAHKEVRLGSNRDPYRIQMGMQNHTEYPLISGFGMGTL